MRGEVLCRRPVDSPHTSRKEKVQKSAGLDVGARPRRALHSVCLIRVITLCIFFVYLLGCFSDVNIGEKISLQYPYHRHVEPLPSCFDPAPSPLPSPPPHTLCRILCHDFFIVFHVICILFYSHILYRHVHILFMLIFIFFVLKPPRFYFFPRLP